MESLEQRIVEKVINVLKESYADGNPNKYVGMTGTEILRKGKLSLLYIEDPDIICQALYEYAGTHESQISIDKRDSFEKSFFTYRETKPISIY